MTTVVIPFAGEEGKTRLNSSRDVRRALAQAMFRDVLAACMEVGEVRVVTPDAELLGLPGVQVVADPGGGQGAAVAAALDAVSGSIAVVNADLPCVVPPDLLQLVEAAPALVAARDGTTNALSLQSAEDFALLYGPGSAARFVAHAAAARLSLPNLADDVDTMADLARLEVRAGRHTRACLAELAGALA